MVKNCCIESCKYEWRPNGSVTFHRFPLKEPELLKKWMMAIPGDRKAPTKYQYICSKHFSLESFNNFTSERRRLKNGVVPKIFSDVVETNEYAQNTAKYNADTQSELDMEIDIKPISFEQDNQGHVSILIPSSNEKKVQFCNAATQVSPQRLKPSNREKELQRRIKVLQQRLKRKEQKLSSVGQMLDFLRRKRVCSSKRS